METFEEMLDNLYNGLNQNNEELKIKLPDPQLIFNGHKTIWKNVKEYLKIIRRPPDHFLKYLHNEITVQVNWISESKSDGLLINQKKVGTTILINIMKKYLKEFVICKSCKSLNSYIEKNKDIRKYEFKCLNCENHYYV